MKAITVYNAGELYCSYSDTDSQSDYFHGCRLGLRAMGELLKTEGGENVRLNANGSGMEPAYERRARQLAKAGGYELAEERGTFANGREWRRFEAKRVAVAVAAC